MIHLVRDFVQAFYFSVLRGSYLVVHHAREFEEVFYVVSRRIV